VAGVVGGLTLTRRAVGQVDQGVNPDRVPGANERISIGVIGTGGRGQALLGEIIGLADAQNVEITAVCDVWKVNLEAAAAKVTERFGKVPLKATRFGELLALDDIDAVVIATPDFAHTPIMIEALKAGKDVYVEKPMSLDIDNANTALDLARKMKRVVQVGTQRRSEGRFKAFAKIGASGVLGKISRISAANNFNHPRWLRDAGDCKRADVDWDAYLFNRPNQSFDPKMLRQWHLYKLFTNGISGLWMAHLVDAAHMITGATYPRSAVAHGGTYVWKENREHTDTFHALIDYPADFLFSWGMGLANAAGTFYGVHGTCGTLDVEKGVLSGDGGAGEGKIAEATKVEPEQNENHMANWLTCLRTRQRPNADIQYGHPAHRPPPDVRPQRPAHVRRVTRARLHEVLKGWVRWHAAQGARFSPGRRGWRRRRTPGGVRGLRR
jgi:predicted dehydrogenase